MYIDLETKSLTAEIRRQLREVGRTAVVGRRLNEFWWEETVPLIQRGLVNVFRTDGYGRWAPLRYREEPPPKLRVTRKYYRAATKPGHNNYLSVGGDTLTWEVNYEQFENSYPLKHEYGGTSDSGNTVPARPVFETLANNPAFHKRFREAYIKWQSKYTRRLPRRRTT